MVFNESCDEEKSRLHTEIGILNRKIDEFINSITCKNHALCSMSESVWEEIYEKKARKHFGRQSFESVRNLPEEGEADEDGEFLEDAFDKEPEPDHPATDTLIGGSKDVRLRRKK